jgi:hypothetical protein
MGHNSRYLMGAKTEQALPDYLLGIGAVLAREV